MGDRHASLQRHVPSHAPGQPPDDGLKRLIAVATSLPFRILVTGTLLATLALIIDWGLVFTALRKASWGWFVLGIPIVFAGAIVAAFRWRAFLQASELPTSPLEALQAYLIGAFANNFLPSAFGGDAVRGVIIGRSGKPLVRALTSVTADRATSLFCLLVLAWIAVALEFGEISRQVIVPLGATTAIGAGTAAVAVLTLRRRGMGRILPTRIRPWAGEAARVVRGYAHDRALLAKVLLLGLAYQGVVMSGFWLVAVALDLGLGLTEFVVVVPTVLLASTLPISIAGFGVREGTFVILLAAYGVSAADATLLSLLIVVQIALASSPGAVAMVTKGVRVHPDPTASGPTLNP